MAAAAVERLIAQHSLSWPEIRRLMTVPCVKAKTTPRAAGIWSTNEMMCEAELELARQAELSYSR